MNKKNRFYVCPTPSGWHLAVVALTVFLAGMSGPVSAVLIDDFSTAAAKIIDNTTDVIPVTSTVSGAGIIGGSRLLSVNLLESSNPATRTVSASVAAGVYGNSYDASALGQSRIVWAGGNNPDSGDMAPPVNLCSGDRFILRFLKNDQPMSYVLRAYSPGGGWSYRAFDVPDDSFWPTPVPPTTPYYDASLPFSTFTIGGGGGANFCNVGRIEVFWDTYNMYPSRPGLDMAIDYVEVNKASYTCNSKMFASTSLSLGPSQNITFPATATFPQTVTAQVSFTVGDADISQGALTITDTLDTGFTYAGPTTQDSGPAGAIVGNPGISSGGQVLTWTNKVTLPAGSTIVFHYAVTVAEPPALPDPPDYRQNRVRLQVLDLPVNEPLSCSAGINQQPAPAFSCTGKTFASAALSLGPAPNITFPATAPFPQTVTAAVTFTNTGAFAIQPGVLTLTDTLEAGFSYVAGTTASNPGGIIVGDPGGSPGPVLTWTNAAAIAPGQTVVLSYQVTVAEPPALPDPPNYRRNHVLLQAPAATPSQCEAGINQQPASSPEYTCNDNTFQSASLKLGPAQIITYPGTTTFPQTVTAAVTFSNTGSVTIPTGALTITDTLDAGLSYVLGTTSQASGPAEIIRGNPSGGTGPTLTWKNGAPIPPMTQVKFTYNVLVAGLSVGVYLKNNVVMQVHSYPTKDCSAQITILQSIPGIHPLGMLIAALMLALTAVFIERRRSS